MSEYKEKRYTNMLYVMNVDWRWIVQRPHILAIEMSKYYHVTVFFPRILIKRWKSQCRYEIPKNSLGIPIIPFQEKSGLIKKINESKIKKSLKTASKYDIVYFSNPQLCKYLDDYTGKVVFDYMDDYVAMSSGEEKENVRYWLNESIKRADLVVTSAQKLYDTTIQLKSSDGIIMARNGSNATIFHKPVARAVGVVVNLAYIGTVSSWLDFDLLKKAVDINKNLTINMIGPYAGYERHESERIHFKGVIEHDRLFDSIADVDCLIMPFKLNDIVLAVDPVKLYEYIGFGKCIISVKYPELERFSEYVYFYETDDEFISLIQELSKSGFVPKYDKEMQSKFLEDNSWENRGLAIKNRIEEMTK